MVTSSSLSPISVSQDASTSSSSPQRPSSTGSHSSGTKMTEFSISNLLLQEIPSGISEEESHSSESSSPESTDPKSSQNSPGSNPNERPPFSYNSLIAMAIQSSPFKRMRLSEIYRYISTHFPYYRQEKAPQWQNSVRHNLSLHKEFQKVKSDDGQGNFWEMTSDLGTEVYIGKECGKLRRHKSPRRRKNKIEEIPQEFSPSPVPVLPQIPLMPMFNPQALLQNQLIFQMLLRNLQVPSLHQPLPSYPLFPFSLPHNIPMTPKHEP